MAGTIQVPACPSRGVVEQAWMTRSNALSIRISQPGVAMKRRSVLRRERETLKACTGSTMRGEGDHHSTGWPGPNQGKMPRR